MVKEVMRELVVAAVVTAINFFKLIVITKRYIIYKQIQRNLKFFKYQVLRNRDKMKGHAIAQLSDQLMALTARMQEFERKQQLYVS
jgi:hypothetical protein